LIFAKVSDVTDGTPCIRPFVLSIGGSRVPSLGRIFCQVTAYERLEGFAMLIALSHIAHASDALSSMREAQENSCPSLGGPLHAKRSFEKTSI
jgi:hypothetical protein